MVKHKNNVLKCKEKRRKYRKMGMLNCERRVLIFLLNQTSTLANPILW